MARVAATLPAPEFREALLESYSVNERMNQLVLTQLDPKAWRAKPPGRNARTIVAIFTHIHNIRRKWLRLSAAHLKLPAELDRALHAKPGAYSVAGKCEALFENAWRSSGRAARPR